MREGNTYKVPMRIGITDKKEGKLIYNCIYRVFKKNSVFKGFVKQREGIYKIIIYMYILRKNKPQIHLKCVLITLEMQLRRKEASLLILK